MAYAKGTDAAGGGSTVNQAWVNKVAEEKWAAEQEEKRRKEREEDARALRESSYNDANAQKQEQLAAKQRAQEQAAAQKAAQEKAQREAAIQAARQRAQEQQERAAQAEAERQRQAEERAQREAAVREAEAQRQEQLAARKAEQERIQREKAAAQAEAAAAAARAAAEAEKKNGSSGLSYTGSGTSDRTKEREAEWQDYMQPHAPKPETPAVTVTPAETDTEAADQWLETPDSVADVQVSQPKMRTVAKRTEEPVVYTGGESSTGAGNKIVRRMAANTKAALTGEEYSGMSPEQLAWLQTPEGQAALANQQAKAANDAALRGAALNSGISFSGQPIVQDKTISGQPMSAADAERIQAVNASLAAADAARNYRDGTPGNQRYVYTGLPNPQVIDRNAAGYVPPAGAITQGSGGITTPTFGEVLQGMANDWLLNRNGGTNPGNEVTSNYRVGTPGEQRYDARYPRTLTPEQEAYINRPDTGPQMETPSFGDVVSEIWGSRGEERTGTTGDLTYSFTPPSKSYESDGTLINPNIGRNSTGEWKAIQQEDKWIQEGYAEAQKMAGWTERDRRAYAQYYADQKAAEAQKNQPTEKTWQEQLAERKARAGEERAERNSNRSGADAALDDILNSSLNEADKARNYRDGTPGGQRYVYRPETTTGGTSGSESGSGKGTKDSTKRSGEERAEKNAPKGTKFTYSYGQPGTGSKLPYQKGGYSASDIEAAGNKARSDFVYNNGSKAYEGYYLAPDGKYYPIDMEKAAYYKANGNSYKGWEEPMREYYKTFGTYYGYRPDWKTAGGKNVWKTNNNVYENYRPAKSSSSSGGSYSNSNNLSYAGGSSGRSYGRGTTTNNGLYWNGNTSWSI